MCVPALFACDVAGQVFRPQAERREKLSASENVRDGAKFHANTLDLIAAISSTNSVSQTQRAVILRIACSTVV